MKDRIELNIVTKESVKTEDFTPREQSIYNAGHDSGFHFGKVMAFISIAIFILLFFFFIGMHQYYKHGSIWADF